MAPRFERKTLLAHLLLLGVVAVWGATFPLIKGALADVSPLLFNLLRMALATMALLALNLRQLRSLSRKDVVLGLIAGAFLGAGYQFQTAGLARTSPTKSAFITGLVVVFVALASTHPAFQTASNPASRRPVVLGAFLSFAGLALLATPTHAAWADMVFGINVGDALTLLCAVAFAGHLLTLSKVEPRTSVGALVTVQVGFSTLIMLLTVRVNGPVHLRLSPRLWTALLITSLLATAAAFTIQSWVQQHLPAPHTAALLSLEAVFALLTSVALFHEQLTARIYVGAALIFLGVLVTERLGSPIPPDPVVGAPPISPSL